VGKNAKNSKHKQQTPPNRLRRTATGKFVKFLVAEPSSKNRWDTEMPIVLGWNGKCKKLKKHTHSKQTAKKQQTTVKFHQNTC
jgi:hypothetical protein